MTPNDFCGQGQPHGQHVWAPPSAAWAKRFCAGLAGAVSIPRAWTEDQERAAVTAFVDWLASNAAYNGADDEGQRFYDLCLNTWLPRQVARYFEGAGKQELTHIRRNKPAETVAVERCCDEGMTCLECDPDATWADIYGAHQ